MTTESRQYHYRSVPVELSPGRYSRDHWEREVWIDRSQFDGNRASEGRIVEKVVLPKKKKNPFIGPQAMHKPADMHPVRGLYEMVGTADMHANGRFSVVAKCKGAFCGGRVRKFPATEWMSAKAKTKIRGCNACMCARRRRDQRVTH